VVSGVIQKVQRVAPGPAGLQKAARLLRFQFYESEAALAVAAADEVHGAGAEAAFPVEEHRRRLAGHHRSLPGIRIFFWLPFQIELWRTDGACNTG
jgi:hypothetical protein